MNEVPVKRLFIEACCGNLADALKACGGGADRIELCSNLFQGGLTPDPGAYLALRQLTDVLVRVMLRPREGGFCYSPEEWKQLEAAFALFYQLGAREFVTGVLTAEGEVDVSRLRLLLSRYPDVRFTFHRAFDVVPDRDRSLEELIELGFDTVLTSGGRSDVSLAAEEIIRLKKLAAGRIQILPGAGLTVGNIAQFVRETESEQVHVALHTLWTDTSVPADSEITYGGGLRDREGNWIYPSERNIQLYDEAALLRFRVEGEKGLKQR